MFLNTCSGLSCICMIEIEIDGGGAPGGKTSQTHQKSTRHALSILHSVRSTLSRTFSRLRNRHTHRHFLRIFRWVFLVAALMKSPLARCQIIRRVMLFAFGRRPARASHKPPDQRTLLQCAVRTPSSSAHIVLHNT